MLVRQSSPASFGLSPADSGGPPVWGVPFELFQSVRRRPIWSWTFSGSQGPLPSIGILLFGLGLFIFCSVVVSLFVRVFVPLVWGVPPLCVGFSPLSGKACLGRAWMSIVDGSQLVFYMFSCIPVLDLYSRCCISVVGYFYQKKILIKLFNYNLYTK